MPDLDVDLRLVGLASGLYSPFSDIASIFHRMDHVITIFHTDVPILDNFTFLFQSLRTIQAVDQVAHSDFLVARICQWKKC